MASRKCIHILYSEIFNGGQTVHKYLYPKVFCTSRASIDGLEAVGTNSVGQAGEGRLGRENRFGTIHFYYYTVDSSRCRTAQERTSPFIIQ